MSSQYNGDGTIPAATSGYNPTSISSSTNATPIEITCGGSHGFATGDTVAIEGHLVNTSANGFWTITVTSATKFTLTGSVGVGVGAATGYAVDYAINPLWALPSGGDTRNASSVSSPLEAAANLAPFMYQRVGKYSLYNIGRIDHSDAIDLGTVATVSVPNTPAWTTINSWNYKWSTTRDVNIYNTDILILQVQAFMVFGTGSVVNGVGLGANFNGGGMTLITGSAQGIYAASVQKSVVFDATLYANDFTATQLNSMTFSVMGYNAGVGAQDMTVSNPYHVNIYHYRINT